MLELLRVGLLELADSPEKLLDAEYDMFGPLATAVPAYANYMRQLEDATALAVDGRTRVSSITMIRAEIYAPTDADNNAARAPPPRVRRALCASAPKANARGPRGGPACRHGATAVALRCKGPGAQNFG